MQGLREAEIFRCRVVGLGEGSAGGRDRSAGEEARARAEEVWVLVGSYELGRCWWAGGRTRKMGNARSRSTRVGKKFRQHGDAKGGHGDAMGGHGDCDNTERDGMGWMDGSMD